MKTLIIIGAVIAALLLLFLIQSKSRKRFIINMLRQVKYLIPRYFT